MARRQSATDNVGLASFYPARYGEPFVVEGEGVRVAVRPVSGTDVTAQIDNGQVIYRGAYLETDSMHVVSAGRSEEFLFLQNECAPREFAYEISEVTAGTRVKLVNGEVRFTNQAGNGVNIEAPWLIEANGALRSDAVHWELDAAQSAAGPQRLRLVVAEGLSYPVMIDPSWRATGNLGTARAFHTATLLQSGKVLVAGGQGTSGFLNSAELHDPATGRWTATGSLATARNFHTATLLPNGKVLVAGGQNGGGSLISAELYDPATGRWSATTSSLGTARVNHTATLLPSGKVLVVGGQAIGGAPLSSAELYDPTTGLWTATVGTLGEARVSHTATLLPSGKVLVAGGQGIGGALLSSAELYDSASGTWTATFNLGTGRSFHTATLLPSGQVLVAGGLDSSGVLSSAELYDPVAGSWSSTGPFGTARDFHTATLLPSGQVLVVGGTSDGINGLSSAELYDPASGTWTATDSFSTARFVHTATLLPSGKVLVAAGQNSSGYLSSAQLYDPSDPGPGSWSSTGLLGTEHSSHTATLLPTGQVLVAGGQGAGSAELYDPATGTWAATGSMGTALSRHTATLLPNGKVLVAGGTSAELYDPATGLWTATGSLSTARYSHTATLLPNGKVLVAGGIDGIYVLSSAELYDPATGTWTATLNMGDPHGRHTATLLPNGKVLVAGGFPSTPFSDETRSAELYDPATGTWSYTGGLNDGRFAHTATLLPNGKVLVAGGFSNPFFPTGHVLDTAELYDPASGIWETRTFMAFPRYYHTATLLPSGKVVVAGGQGIGGALLSSAELFDPATGFLVSDFWRNTGSMGTARLGHTATLLPSGKVLVAGGQGSGNSAELYDPGLGYDANWQPLLVTVSPSILPNGGALTASGSRFKGISEASGGNSGAQNSSSNYPLVQLRSLANEQTLFLPVDALTGWSNTSFTSTPIAVMTTSLSGFPIGYALVTVFTNGIPSESQFVVTPPCDGTTFTNPTPIVINDRPVSVPPAPASPYPSDIVVAGVPGAVTRVTVKLNSITHSRPADIDMLLIGPGGQTAMIMSDAGGSPGGISNVTLTLDDFAADPLPVSTPAPPVLLGHTGRLTIRTRTRLILIRFHPHVL